MKTWHFLTLSSCMLLLFGCAAITEQDLIELQSPNAIVKEETIKKMTQKESLLARLFSGFIEDTYGRKKKAVTILVKQLESKTEAKEVEAMIINTLGHLGRDVDVPIDAILERLVDDKHKRIQANAIEALGKIKNFKATVPLLTLLKDVDAKTKYPIIWALGEIGDPAVIQTLNGLLDDKDEFVRYNARRALAKIGKRPEQTISDRISVSQIIQIGQAIFTKYQQAVASFISSQPQEKA